MLILIVTQGFNQSSKIPLNLGFSMLGFPQIPKIATPLALIHRFYKPNYNLGILPIAIYLY